MKVREAKEKVCPFIQNIAQYNWQKSHDEYECEANINCVCGNCMAWQYTKEHTYKELNERNKQNIKDYESKGYKWFDGCEWRKELDEDEKEGYCKRLGE